AISLMLKYLWTNRERQPVLSRLWLKSWAKRLLTLPRLLGSICRQAMLRLQGAIIESPVFIAPCNYNGLRSYLKISRNTFIGRVALHLYDRIDIGSSVVINDGAVLFTASHDVESKDFRT